jgi:Pentapeptide repeats (8 copies)
MPPAAGERDVLLARHREVSESLNRSMLTLLTFCLFCWLTLGSPDRMLVVDDPTIKVPFIDVTLSFFSFLIVGPFLLVVFAIYLHVFFRERMELEAALVDHGGNRRAAMLFNLDSPAARLLTGFVFYWLVPLTLGGIAWKALARPEWGAPMLLLTVTITLALAYVWHVRSSERGNLRRARLLYGGLAVVINVTIGGIFLAFDPTMARRQLDLYRANLQSVWLVGSDLARADLRFANLPQAYLNMADLTGANLTAANLTGANLTAANLTGADLTRANLTGANLRRADLAGANLAVADLTGADLTMADLIGADLTRANLTDTLLSSTRFADQEADPAHALTQAQLDLTWAWADAPPDLGRLNPPLALPEARLCDPALQWAWSVELYKRPRNERSYGPPASCSGAAGAGVAAPSGGAAP